MKATFLLFATLFVLQSCNENKSQQYLESGMYTNATTESVHAIDPMWYQGKAEINVYDIQQNRYNALHEGEAVLIFVTEDFLSDKQVKNDNYTSKNSVPIIKNNQIRKFTTGLYDYSIFTSVFTSVDHNDFAKTYKITTSSQDWCGQSYTQVNNKSSKLHWQNFSYFENEGDLAIQTDDVLVLDEVPNLIRIHGDDLPLGKMKVIPSSVFLRLRHKDIKKYSAKAKIKDYTGDLTEAKAKEYSITIPELKLEYTYIFTDDKKRDILQWEESYPSAFDGKTRSTVATRKSTEWVDYWSKNNPSDYDRRKKLSIKYQ